MKNTIFSWIIPALLIVGLAIALTSCEQGDMENIAEETITKNTQLDLKKPNILANVTSGHCCSVVGPRVLANPSLRNVEIILNSTTYDTFCANGNSLIYKFYRYDNPTALPIVRTSSSFAPTFCLPIEDLALLICNGESCGLSYGLAGFSSIPNTGASSSPIYDITPQTCYRFPID